MNPGAAIAFLVGDDSKNILGFYDSVVEEE
jgi:hypothetical protein